MGNSPAMGGWQATQQSAGAGSYVLASWLFLRLLGVIYLVAFASLGVQIPGLIGQNGLLPAVELLNGRRHWGAARFWRWPTLCWWCNSDRGLVGLCWGGVVLSVLLIAGLAPVPVLVLLWALYLSLFTVGRLFLCYQWDILLLETGFLAIFLAPPEVVPRAPTAGSWSPPTLALWLCWWLLFRLMFWSGAVKVRSGDVTWRNLSALGFHYETQPLPTPLAWYAHQLPVVVHKASVAVVLAIELGAPFLIFAPAPWRYGAAGAFVILMVLIELTGNFAFFNLLGIALSLLLLDDRVWLAGWRVFAEPPTLKVLPTPEISVALSLGASIIIMVLSIDSVVRMFRTAIQWPGFLARFFDVLEPFHLVNSYGLFAIMTTWRPEIIVEGSNDGRDWQAYEFKWKPGDICRAPPFVAPHQPRLDWQLWFAALGVHVSNAWFERFLQKLKQGAPEVLALLAKNPFPDAPPRYLRSVQYDYHFTTRAERRDSGAWWRREKRRN
jgi:hypothetical protein